MKQQKAYKKSRLFILKPLLFLLKVLQFLLIIFLHLVSGTKQKHRYKPTLQEQVMGENIPFSDQYYIPDDHFSK